MAGLDHGTHIISTSRARSGRCTGTVYCLLHHTRCGPPRYTVYHVLHQTRWGPHPTPLSPYCDPCPLDRVPLVIRQHLHLHLKLQPNTQTPFRAVAGDLCALSLIWSTWADIMCPCDGSRAKGLGGGPGGGLEQEQELTCGLRGARTAVGGM